jgi:nicotinamidase-related amidase
MKKIDYNRAVVINVDVQKAFGEEAQSPKLQGLRPTEKAEVENAAKLSSAAYAAGATIVVTQDWHNTPGTVLPDGKIDDRAKDEFEIYGEHSVGKTPDAELSAPLAKVMSKLERAEGQPRTIIPVDKYDDTGRVGSSRLIEVHKNTYDVTKRLDLDGQMRPHASFIDTLSKLRAGGVDTAIITGKIAEVCVRAAVSSLRELFPDMRIIVAEDAVSALPAEVAGAVGLDSKEKVIAALEAQGVEIARTASLLPSARFMVDGVLGR